MDIDGYPDDDELAKIENWDWHDAMGLINFVVGRWNWQDWGVKQKWAKDSTLKRSWVLHLELHTGGWSGNESLINAVLRNRMITAVLNYRMWRAGGHYYFEFNPKSNGFLTASEYCKEHNVSRQYVHQNKSKFIWMDAGPKIKMIKPNEDLPISRM